MPLSHLDFEKPIVELERKIEDLRTFAADERVEVTEEIARLEQKLLRLKEEIFSKLTPYQRVQLARHPRRPYPLDYIHLIFDDFLELYGDRLYADDRAIIGGWAFLNGESLIVVGHQKGRDTQENLYRNFGMPHPEGYRKALRFFYQAAKFHRPIVTLIDTPGAYPGIGAEERGQAEAIARNLREMASLEVPIVVVIVGEGGSGGALAIGVGDRILMLENAIYSVISPEGCAAILWNDSTKKELAAEALKLTAADLFELGVIDEVIPEPLGGAHPNYHETARRLKEALVRNLRELMALDYGGFPKRREEKYSQMGVHLEEEVPVLGLPSWGNPQGQ